MWIKCLAEGQKVPGIDGNRTRQQLSNLICQNCDESIKILLDEGNQQHAV